MQLLSRPSQISTEGTHVLVDCVVEGMGSSIIGCITCCCVVGCCWVVGCCCVADLAFCELILRFIAAAFWLAALLPEDDFCIFKGWDFCAGSCCVAGCGISVGVGCGLTTPCCPCDNFFISGF